MLGAPVVISLIAGLAIPVIIVGIPIYMGRKVADSQHSLELHTAMVFVRLSVGVSVVYPAGPCSL